MICTNLAIMLEGKNDDIDIIRLKAICLICANMPSRLVANLVADVATKFDVYFDIRFCAQGVD